MFHNLSGEKNTIDKTNLVNNFKKHKMLVLEKKESVNYDEEAVK